MLILKIIINVIREIESIELNINNNLIIYLNNGGEPSSDGGGPPFYFYFSNCFKYENKV